MPYVLFAASALGAKRLAQSTPASSLIGATPSTMMSARVSAKSDLKIFFRFVFIFFASILFFTAVPFYTLVVGVRVLSPHHADSIRVVGTGLTPRPQRSAETLYRLRRYRTAARAVPTVCGSINFAQISRLTPQSWLRQSSSPTGEPAAVLILCVLCRLFCEMFAINIIAIYVINSIYFVQLVNFEDK